jgi:transcriptional regulator with XRE-family HTH domain
MRYNLALFPARLRRACKNRNTTVREVGEGIGLSPRRVIDLEVRGLRCLDTKRLSQLAERLDVSIDWLLGAPEHR